MMEGGGCSKGEVASGKWQMVGGWWLQEGWQGLLAAGGSCAGGGRHLVERFRDFVHFVHHRRSLFSGLKYCW